MPQPPPPLIYGLQHCHKSACKTSLKLQMTTHVDVPHTLANIVRTRTGACLGCITTNDLVPLWTSLVKMALHRTHCDSRHRLQETIHLWRKGLQQQGTGSRLRQSRKCGREQSSLLCRHHQYPISNRDPEACHSLVENHTDHCACR